MSDVTQRRLGGKAGLNGKPVDNTRAYARKQCPAAPRCRCIAHLSECRRKGREALLERPPISMISIHA